MLKWLFGGRKKAGKSVNQVRGRSTNTPDDPLEARIRARRAQNLRMADIKLKRPWRQPTMFQNRIYRALFSMRNMRRRAVTWLAAEIWSTTPLCLRALSRLLTMPWRIGPDGISPWQSYVACWRTSPKVQAGIPSLRVGGTVNWGRVNPRKTAI